MLTLKLEVSTLKLLYEIQSVKLQEENGLKTPGMQRLPVQHCIYGSFHSQGHDKSILYSSLNSHMSFVFCVS